MSLNSGGGGAATTKALSIADPSLRSGCAVDKATATRPSAFAALCPLRKPVCFRQCFGIRNGFAVTKRYERLVRKIGNALVHPSQIVRSFAKCGVIRGSLRRRRFRVPKGRLILPFLICQASCRFLNNSSIVDPTRVSILDVGSGIAPPPTINGVS